jgi:hypothetical protein
MSFRAIESLKETNHRTKKHLTIVAMVSYFLFTIIVTSAMVLTDFKLEGY